MGSQDFTKLEQLERELRQMGQVIEQEKTAFMAAPPMPQGPPPMDPAMMAQGMPMDPAMMGQGMPPMPPPMDPAMMAQGMPMDPAMMGQGMPPMDPSAMAPPPADDDKLAQILELMKEMAGNQEASNAKIAELENEIIDLQEQLSQMSQMLTAGAPQ